MQKLTTFSHLATLSYSDPNNNTVTLSSNTDNQLTIRLGENVAEGNVVVSPSNSDLIFKKPGTYLIAVGAMAKCTATSSSSQTISLGLSDGRLIQVAAATKAHAITTATASFVGVSGTAIIQICATERVKFYFNPGAVTSPYLNSAYLAALLVEEF